MAVVVLERGMRLDRRDGAVMGVMGGVLVHVMSLSVGGNDDIRAEP
jgi:hypothetical protein